MNCSDISGIGIGIVVRQAILAFCGHLYREQQAKLVLRVILYREWYCLKIRVTLNIKNPRTTFRHYNLRIFLGILIMYVHKNIVNSLLIYLYNDDKIFCKNSYNIFLIQISTNFREIFFLKLFVV